MYKLIFRGIPIKIKRIVFKKEDYFLAEIDRKHNRYGMIIGWDSREVHTELNLSNGIYYCFHISYLDEIKKNSFIMDVE